MFQFQCGAIGSVRQGGDVVLFFKFQFQCGAIGSLVEIDCIKSFACFNSSVVRLVDNNPTHYIDFYAVSIPVWCDW